MLSNSTSQTPTASYLPPGYTVGTAPDGQRYLTPTFMVPALNQALDAHAKKQELEASKAKSGSHQVENLPYAVIGEGKIMIPTDPGLSQRELLMLHADVLALQQRLGISYKDASHRLYMAELEKLKADEVCYREHKGLSNQLETSLERIQETLRCIEDS